MNQTIKETIYCTPVKKQLNKKIKKQFYDELKKTVKADPKIVYFKNEEYD
jgi:hypothetical protein